MPVAMSIRDDLSIQDIEKLAQTHVLEVTPHVGNWTTHRLVLPTLGIKVLCVDHTIGERDINTHPHLLIIKEQAHVLCTTSDRLTTHGRVAQRINGYPYLPGTSLADVHVGTVRELYPEADIVTHSEFLAEHRELAMQLYEILMPVTKPTTLWWRRVDAKGVVTQYRKRDLPHSFSEVRDDIFRLSNQHSGWLMHNRMAILMDVILQSEGGVVPHIYHLSGPDMVRYLESELVALSRMYDVLRKRLGLVQKEITINLVPFASFPFATRTTQAAAAEALAEELSKKKPSEATVQHHVREAFDVLAHASTKAYFTQHDCIASGERVVVPEITRTWSMATCQEMSQLLKS